MVGSRTVDMLDFVVVGGGLGGLVAALRLAEVSGGTTSIALLDDPLPEAEGALGGFAKFSGAKFSLPPAGMGLLPLVGGDADALGRAYRATLELLDLPMANLQPSIDLPFGDGELALRKYDSILLSPPELERLITRVEQAVISADVRVIKARVLGLASGEGSGWSLQIQSVSGAVSTLSAERIIFAAGRRGGNILKQAGAKSQLGKGIDLGVRVEFHALEAVAALRALGADAKVLHGSARTFCLNSPGHIFRYDADGMCVAGGIVAKQGHCGANFGLLTRVECKALALEALRSGIKRIPHVIEVNDGTPLGSAVQAVEILYGREVASSLIRLAALLGDKGLVDWRHFHQVHLPLIDWHWDVFALPGRFETSLPGVFAIGDAGGQARGLLQAAVSGYILADRS